MMIPKTFSCYSLDAHSINALNNAIKPIINTYAITYNNAMITAKTATHTSNIVIIMLPAFPILLFPYFVGNSLYDMNQDFQKNIQNDYYNYDYHDCRPKHVLIHLNTDINNSCQNRQNPQHTVSPPSAFWVQKRQAPATSTCRLLKPLCKQQITMNK